MLRSRSWSWTGRSLCFLTSTLRTGWGWRRSCWMRCVTRTACSTWARAAASTVSGPHRGLVNVVAVDVNPAAVACAKDNARRNGVADRVTVLASDLFRNASGRFDLIIFDPPFRWFRPRDMFERGTADENYLTLSTFFDQASDHLQPSGRILLSFGTTGDIAYLQHLITTHGFAASERRRVEGEKDGLAVAYIAYRLIIPPTPNGD